MVFPLNADGTLYYIQDERGNCIGTGTRDVCHTILQIMIHSTLTARATPAPRVAHKQNAQPTSAAKAQKLQLAAPLSMERNSSGFINSIRDGSQTIFKR